MTTFSRGRLLLKMWTWWSRLWIPPCKMRVIAPWASPESMRKPLGTYFSYKTRHPSLVSMGFIEWLLRVKRRSTGLKILTRSPWLYQLPPWSLLRFRKCLLVWPFWLKGSLLTEKSSKISRIRRKRGRISDGHCQAEGLNRMEMHLTGVIMPHQLLILSWKSKEVRASRRGEKPVGNFTTTPQFLGSRISPTIMTNQSSRITVITLMGCSHRRNMSNLNKFRPLSAACCLEIRSNKR